jgi:hypothetical protein
MEEPAHDGSVLYNPPSPGIFSGGSYGTPADEAASGCPIGSGVSRSGFPLRAAHPAPSDVRRTARRAWRRSASARWHGWLLVSEAVAQAKRVVPIDQHAPAGAEVELTGAAVSASRVPTRPICPRREQRECRLPTNRIGQLSNVVDLARRNDQAATLSGVISLSSLVSSSVTLMPSLNFTPASRVDAPIRHNYSDTVATIGSHPTKRRTGWPS